MIKWQSNRRGVVVRRMKPVTVRSDREKSKIMGGGGRRIFIGEIM